MIGHQAIGKQPRSRPLDRFFQHLFHCGKVRRLTEQPHPPHAPIEYVVHQPARSCTNPPRHANSIPETASLSIETTSDPFASSPTPLRRPDLRACVCSFLPSFAGINYPSFLQSRLAGSGHRPPLPFSRPRFVRYGHQHFRGHGPVFVSVNNLFYQTDAFGVPSRRASSSIPVEVVRFNSHSTKLTSSDCDLFRSRQGSCNPKSTELARMFNFPFASSATGIL